MSDINTHIANLSSQLNKAISKYAQLDMCRIKNILVSDRGRIGYIRPPESLNKEIDLQKAKINMLFEELNVAIKERDYAETSMDE